MGYIREKILKDKSVRFQAEIRLKGYRTITAIFNRKNDAKKWIQKVETEIRCCRNQLYSEAKRHTLKEARLELERLKKEKEKLKLTISKEIDAAWRDMQLASKEVVQNREVEELERLKLEEEEKFFNRGKSDSKTIIDFQDDLINAEIEHIRALVGYVKSVESFYKYQNSLMEYAGLEKVVE